MCAVRVQSLTEVLKRRIFIGDIKVKKKKKQKLQQNVETFVHVFYENSFKPLKISICDICLKKKNYELENFDHFGGSNVKSDNIFTYNIHLIYTYVYIYNYLFIYI